jgi:crotonobetainyl-CoA:carnitine CoA-transferase CaiB-like acyl-CoA transferase
VEETFINFLMTKTKAELNDQVIPRRLILAPILDAKDLAAHSQLAERDYWAKVNHPELGEDITYCGPFAKLNQAPIDIQRPPPIIGEHNLEVYEQELGFSKSQIGALKSAGVI